MFYQICVREEDKDSLNFVWCTDTYEDLPDVYVMQVNTFRAASFPWVANCTLRRVANDNVQDFSPIVIAAIKRSFYVDDVLPSKNDEQSAVHLARVMVDILARGSFNLTKFTSNSKEVLKTVPSDKLSSHELNLDLKDTPVERALGLFSFVGDDTLQNKASPRKKSGILSCLLLVKNIC